PGALACNQVELSQPLTFLSRGDQGRTAVELIHDLEDLFLQLVWRNFGCEQPSDPEMGLGAQVFWDQGVRCLLDPVMQKSIGTFRLENEPSSDCFPQVTVHFNF